MRAGEVRWARVIAAWIVVALTSALVLAATRDSEVDASRAATVPARALATTTTTSTSTTTTTTTEPPTTTTTEPPATTTEPPATAPPATVAPVTAPPATEPAPAPAATGGTWTAAPYAGLGTWIDVYDWTAAFGGAQISIADIDQMAADGVQTLYVQPVRWNVDTDLMETDRLLPLLHRARSDGMRVVAWYLPDLQDIDNDLRHLYAIANRLPIDGLAIDIESRSVQDVDLRNAQLLGLSDRLRATFPGQVLGGIVLPPVVTDQINPAYWPGFPWAGVGRDYDVWLPMSYFTNRVGAWRDAASYTAANVAGVRADLGQPGALVHAIGGIGDHTTTADVNGMLSACAAQGCFGASIYDYRTTQDPDVRAALRAFRS